MWDAADTRAQEGQVAVVTGANSGLGFEVAKTLALEARPSCWPAATKARARRPRLASPPRGCATGPSSGVVDLDLASLTSVRRAAEEIASRHARIDLLINNAGVMHVVPYQRGADGIELTFATNHLGHFALTGLLMDRILAADAARVVTVSSLAHKRGQARFDESPSAAGYKPGRAYDESKLANLLFTYELQRRLEVVGAAAIAVAAHPGQADTALWRTSSSIERALVGPRLRAVTFWLAQSAQAGALPVLRAALDGAVRGGEYYGPRGWFECTGHPVRVESSPASHDAGAQRGLWTLSERLTDVRYSMLDAAAAPDER